MRVLHIIPGAFDYFEDIRTEAFALMDDLEAIGVETEAFVLEYGPTKVEEPWKKDETADGLSGSSTVNKKHSFKGAMSVTAMLERFEAFDVVHLHVPFFGGGHALRRWKERHPDRPFVMTYYRSVRTPDMFSLLISWYNAYYLGKLARQADIVVSKLPELPSVFAALPTMVRLDSSTTIAGAALPPEVVAQGLTMREIFAWKYAMVYTMVGQK